MATLQERVITMKQQIDQIKVKIAESQARDLAARKKKEKSDEAMKKKILGKVMYDLLATERAPELLKYLEKNVHKPDDRILFGFDDHHEKLTVEDSQ